MLERSFYLQQLLLYYSVSAKEFYCENQFSKLLSPLTNCYCQTWDNLSIGKKNLSILVSLGCAKAISTFIQVWHCCIALYLSTQQGKCLRKREESFSSNSLGAIRKIPQGIPDISMMIDGQYRGNSKMYYSSVLVHMPDLHQYPSVYA